MAKKSTNTEKILKRLLRNIEIELSGAFDLNFERKRFFDRPWPRRRYPGRRGSLLIVSGALRRSIRSRTGRNKIVWTSYLPYARIHNEGGEITVTPRMKRFFWWQFRQTDKRSPMAGFYKAMALKRAGDKIHIPERRFIGPHREVDRIVKKEIDEQIKEIDQTIKQILNPKNHKR